MFAVTLHGHKEATGGINALGGQPLEKGVFEPALTRRGGVGFHITRTAVKQAVVGPGGPGVEVAFFQHHGTHPSQGQIARQAGTSDAGADDEHGGFQELWRLHRLRPDSSNFKLLGPTATMRRVPTDVTFERVTVV